MNHSAFIKPIPLSELKSVIDLVDYQQNNIIQKMLVDNEAISITILSFDKGESMTNLINPGETMTQILEGDVSVMTGRKKQVLSAGEVVIIPAKTVHQIKASERAKVLYTVVKDPKIIRIEE